MTDEPHRHLATRAVHAGNAVDPGTGAIRRPLVAANSYALPDDPSELSWSGTGTPLYTRNGGANQGWLEEKLAALDGGEAALALATGVAALHAVFFTLLRTGDHVVCSDVTYAATHQLLTALLPDKYGIETTLVDSADPGAVRAAMRPTTRLVHVETPANPTTKITDVAAVAEVAHAGGALLSVDATFATPVLQRPLELGADLVVHSLTKYVNGHGDAMGGAVIGSAGLVERIRLEAGVNAGATISPFNAWLIMRGAVTLPMRMRAHCAGAQVVAEFLAQDPRVAYVAYPGLPDHPQHALAARTLDGGFGGMLAFAVRGDPGAQNRFVAALELITSAVSLGHDESLIVHVGTDGPRAAHWPEEFRRWGHLRLSVGLEDPRDLVADIEQALARTVAPDRTVS
ncbi:aminotransferase class I/II-fold pyridoxal phosphate-dependent enzyme [Pseudonocardia sp. KRD-184]|uniref:Aminotransferase class I/II-fold pyridoxal phosphate-dependent enzyme n=1 Tax=Pseudonocardia oceani TaxID=2792013 RepID=A0ABS6UJD3_9PSEU|nr:aminotransferase class I/II-fold pyridoxal phosphate-dependent enzyme [Pseudonocardia oceani]MBW0091132.1 aminotransferase class I/II-fold pyridoxal phosphate-dependent enzyme [Pseudonocardia oceani]MBW0096854.1 aminotransferase class I/II-fold pyridoxal phosphate-dependent enzyme [Pseudonocardia oceani]MBW0109515.1 aminotransferase class I/II-fold pyridoxal phosphate-dependent enzyme [Pseudonocardia oceani]MBW0121306.1 aminotransferase class I/II-fold pyridoxal phosphate-dependent enzyme [P